MDSYRTQLVGISDYRILEDQIIEAKTRSLLQRAHPGVIVASVNPSNLVEPTKLGERFALDSCVEGNDLKYVWGNGLIDNTSCQTELVQLEKCSAVRTSDTYND